MSSNWLFPDHPITFHSAKVSASFKERVRRSFALNYRFYRSQHLTTGCRITHMIGVPMIIISFLILPFKPRAAASLQVVGWILQGAGHYVFEHNKPVLLEVRNTMTIWSALVFVASLWKDFLLKGKVAPL